MKKVGFFGGTFDPIHFGHLNVLVQMLENEDLDQVIVCPTGLSPFKENKRPAESFLHRKKMCELALKGIPNAHVIDLEQDELEPSYTIDSIKFLTSKFSKDRFNIIISQDMLVNISKWKDIEKLIEIAPPLICTREDCDEKIWGNLSKSAMEILRYGIRKTAIMEISSTMVRERLKKRLYCGHLVPKEVLDYIEENKLYLSR